jgi:hypothetical protein
MLSAWLLRSSTSESEGMFEPDWARYSALDNLMSGSGKFAQAT